ncbi:hypothetical protein SAMN04490183_2036 [Pseudomonas corrugata]|nr:hypothetical protein SAMN04490183_2036 [Pseudomonas corrugata]
MSAKSPLGRVAALKSGYSMCQGNPEGLLRSPTGINPLATVSYWNPPDA